jgi:hypothetical protein
MNQRYRVFDKTVVLGKATHIALNTAFHVNALAVPLSFILIISLSPCTGVPPGALNSSAPACAVMTNISVVDTSSDVPVSVVYEAAETIRD